MTPYTTVDYKKYVYAKGQRHIRRIEEIITALGGAYGFDPEDTNDLGYLLDDAVSYLWQAAFVDDHRQSDAEAQARIACARAHMAAGPDLEIEMPHEAADIYSDGRTVTTTVRFGDNEDDYVTHVWHPDPEHPDNQPEAEHEFSRGPYPFRHGLLEVLVPGSIRVVYGDEDNLPEDPELTDSQSSILEVLRERKRKRMVPSHQDAYHLAQQLGMTQQQIIEDEKVLSDLGLIRNPSEHLTEDQLRVLDLLPNEYDLDPSAGIVGITTRQIAEQLGMTIDEVRQHMRALERLGWTSDPHQCEEAAP